MRDAVSQQSYVIKIVPENRDNQLIYSKSPVTT